MPDMELRDFLTKINKDGPEPTHQQVAAQLRTAITTGKLKEGEQLPQGIRLADWLGTSLTAVQEGLVILHNEGLTVPGLKNGVFVRARHRDI
jgi:DNA-binding FadR family transcriptional regulator